MRLQTYRHRLMKSGEQIPMMVGGMQVSLFNRIDERHKPTENCAHIIAGSELGPAWGLVICDAGDHGYYLIRCEDGWTPIADTWHYSIDSAKDQAKFEYENVEETWESPSI